MRTLQVSVSLIHGYKVHAIWWYGSNTITNFLSMNHVMDGFSVPNGRAHREYHVLECFYRLTIDLKEDAGVELVNKQNRRFQSSRAEFRFSAHVLSTQQQHTSAALMLL